jgi:hypothetical protein
LQLQVLRVEPRHHVADVHAIADIDDAADHLAGDPEAEIRLVAGAHDAYEFARRILVFKGDALNLYRTLGFHGCRGRVIGARREQRKEGDDDHGAQQGD